MKYQNTFMTSLLVPLLLTSCLGGGSGSGSSSTPTKEENKLETEMLGTYIAVLSPVNSKVLPKIRGAMTLLRERGELIADLRLSGAAPGSMHPQNIHVGTRCPTKEDDLNRDGHIDAEEGALVYDKIIIPLDDDLNSGRMGGGTFPVADAYGHYSYSRVANWDKFMEDLREEDINPLDDYVKLPHEKGMTAIGKVVVVLGAPSDVPLPESVMGRGRMGPHAALPIACGVIEKLTHVPGRIDNDHTGIPYPGGEAQGGSGGGDDGAIFTPHDEMGSTSGNYGDDDDNKEDR